MLDQILQDKRAEIARLNAATLRNVRPSTRDFGFAAGTGRRDLALMALLARRDPFEPDTGPDVDLVAAAGALQELGIVSALVVATEARYWGGGRDDLVALDRSAAVPLVRDDFVVDELQLYESRRAGADAVLLRAGLVPADVLRGFLRTLASMHMSGVVLVHDRAEMDRALEVEAQVVAISNRDPVHGAVDLGRTLALAPLVPPGRSVLSLDGFATADDVARVRGRVDGIVLGQALLRAPDRLAFLRRLVPE